MDAVCQPLALHSKPSDCSSHSSSSSSSMVEDDPAESSIHTALRAAGNLITGTGTTATTTATTTTASTVATVTTTASTRSFNPYAIKRHVINDSTPAAAAVDASSSSWTAATERPGGGSASPKRPLKLHYPNNNNPNNSIINNTHNDDDDEEMLFDDDDEDCLSSSNGTAHNNNINNNYTEDDENEALFEQHAQFMRMDTKDNETLLLPSNAHRSGATGTSANTNNTPSENDDTDDLMEGVDENVETGHAASIRLGLQKQQQQQQLQLQPADIYSFERYQENKRWRSERASSPMKAKRWKAAAAAPKPLQPSGGDDDSSNEDEDSDCADRRRLPGNPIPASSGSSKPTAPDSLLLSFVQKPSTNTQRRQCRMARNPVPGRTCVPMTLRDGTRIYVPIGNATALATTTASSTGISNLSRGSGGSTGSLGVSMGTLLKRVETTRRQREYDRIQRKFSSSHESAIDSSDTVKMDDGISIKPDGAGPNVTLPNNGKAKRIDANSQLWVDKHAPSLFTHLLSEERCNREVVRALRLWDPYVFGREPPKRPEFQRNNPNYKHNTNENKANYPKKIAKEDEKKSSNDKRPDESNRVLLLSGPPGVGKTTLAHIIARHAGYRPVEVNGSDERTETALSDRVTRAMESSTLNYGPDARFGNRPNCLILDEIDGADAAKSIQALVEIIRSDIPSKGTKTKTPYLRRPIIFICNNKFAPALKALLPYSRQFNVNPPSSVRLVERLQSVLAAERMSLYGGSALLNQLVTSASGDIRSCLYTLQYASSRAKMLADWRSGSTTRVDISKALENVLNGTGLKDERNDIGGTITTVFRKPKEAQFGAVQGGLKPSEKVLQAVNSFGDNSKILDCLFMNILRVFYTDPTLDRCAAAHEWLSSSDLYRSHATNGMNGYALEALHIPAAAAAVHLLCRVEQRPDLTFSTRELADSQYLMESNDLLVKKFVEGTSLQAHCTRNSSQVAIDTVPYALWVLSAGEGSSALNRAVTSIDLLSNGERRAFDHHTASIRSLGLSYVPDNDDALNEKGYSVQAVEHKLDPPIERLTKFALPNHRQSIPPALKELLSQQAKYDRIVDSKRNQAPAQSTVKTLVNAIKPAVASDSLARPKPHKAVNATSSAKTSSNPPAANFLLAGAKNAKAARSARTAARVGCFAKSSKQNKLSNTGSGQPISQVVRLKYVKGFTQAVSTPCRLEDLL